MANQQQQDELLALSSILADSIQFSTNSQNNQTTASIKLQIDLGNDLDFVIHDYFDPPAPAPPSPIPSSTQINHNQLANSVNSLRLSDKIGQNDARVLRNGAVSEEKKPSRTSRGGRRRGRAAGSHSDSGSGGSTLNQPQTSQPPQTPPPISPPLAQRIAPNRPAVPVNVTATPAATATESATPARPAPVLTLVRPKSPPRPPLSQTQTTSQSSPLTPSQPSPTSLKLRYLPPLSLSLILPSLYPDSSQPIVKLQDDVGWLTSSEMDTLRENLENVWQGYECLWEIVDMLSGERVVELLWRDEKVIERKQLEKGTTTLSSALKEHDRRLRSSTFSRDNFVCGICLEAKKGRKCVSLSSCKDVFCLECLVDYFTLLITEGLVRSVHCPSVSCVKARSSRNGNIKKEGESLPGDVSKDELLEIVGEELVKRWEWLVEKTRLEADPSISYCPREACQAPVVKDNDDEKLRICNACGYSYCVFCRKTWHGTQTPCAITHSSALVDKYLNGSDEEKSALEGRYGAANIRRLVAVYEEERMNREWIEAHSTSCPGCDVQVEKSQGCSHMQCAKCNTHFCYRCGSYLSAVDPYKHYSTPGSSCYNKLFDFVPGNEPPPEEWINQILDEDPH